MAIKVGVVGLGFMGGMHMGVYAESEDVEIVAVADTDKKKLKGKLSGAGNIENPALKKIDFKSVRRYDDAMQLIADPAVDLVDVCLPTHLHAKYVVAALKAGKHVMCEKPLGRTAADCDKILDADRRARGSLLMVGHCMRFWPEYVFLKDVVDKAIYGKVRIAEFLRLSPTPTWSSDDWLMDPRKAGGAALDLHVHDIDVVTWLFGKPKMVSSIGVKDKRGIGHITTTYTYNKTMQVTAEGGWLFDPAFPFRMAYRVVCEKASLEMDTRNDPTLAVYTADGKVEHPKVMAQDGYTREIHYMLERIKHNEKPTVITPKIAAENVKIALAEIQSVKTDKPVALRGR